jgi:inosose dehydratase
MSEGQGVVQDNGVTGNGAPGDAGHLGNGGGPAGAGKIAGAPISWGVCEVPGWGYQLSPDRVLAEMTEVGLAATELGPAGFLPDDPGHAARVLRQHHLAPVGGFVPVRLHVPDHDPLPEIEQVLQGYADTGSRTLVVSADSGLAGYDTRPALDEDGWTTLLTNLDRLSALATQHGVLAVLHPHVGTMVENSCEVRRVLDGSSVALCLDTGHLLIGGTDPAELARQVPGRIAHTHLKDVNGSIAAKVRSGRITYTEGVREGMYRPLGAGDVDVEAIVSVLGRRGYDGWYVLEQDTILTEEPAGEGPVADVRTSAEYVRSVLTGAPTPHRPLSGGSGRSPSTGVPPTSTPPGSAA